MVQVLIWYTNQLLFYACLSVTAHQYLLFPHTALAHSHKFPHFDSSIFYRIRQPLKKIIILPIVVKEQSILISYIFINLSLILIFNFINWLVFVLYLLVNFTIYSFFILFQSIILIVLRLLFFLHYLLYLYIFLFLISGYFLLPCITKSTTH